MWLKFSNPLSFFAKYPMSWTQMSKERYSERQPMFLTSGSRWVWITRNLHSSHHRHRIIDIKVKESISLMLSHLNYLYRKKKNLLWVVCQYFLMDSISNPSSLPANLFGSVMILSDTVKREHFSIFSCPWDFVSVMLVVSINNILKKKRAWNWDSRDIQDLAITDATVRSFPDRFSPLKM